MRTEALQRVQGEPLAPHIERVRGSVIELIVKAQAEMTRLRAVIARLEAENAALRAERDARKGANNANE